MLGPVQHNHSQSVSCPLACCPSNPNHPTLGQRMRRLHGGAAKQRGSRAGLWNIVRAGGLQHLRTLWSGRHTFHRSRPCPTAIGKSCSWPGWQLRMLALGLCPPVRRICLQWEWQWRIWVTGRIRATTAVAVPIMEAVARAVAAPGGRVESASAAGWVGGGGRFSGCSCYG